MRDTLDNFKWMGPFATPIAITLSLLALILTLQSYAQTVGWRLVSLVLFGATTAWAAWYLLARTTKDSELEGVTARRVPRHSNRVVRLVVLFLPLLAGGLSAYSLLQPPEPDYSDLLQGGGPYSPAVVFVSEPPGATVKLADVLAGENDPWLESEDNKSIMHLGETVTRARLYTGHYWVVFELNGKRIQKHIVVTEPMVVKAEF